ncbi:hypothetical protein [Limimaricola cinnabarinus]|uniref:Uncharacterized protein n=1 Tax=Limimaricola cinnabarinus LL-001 TaxID=1337093 RepID=U3ART0_9RHOB|nr:hypothetical protein [Limimaricola cinnabarinus]GAD57438.1 hypothetical protein MBELCI_3490 [Limimaricola cinnabarinus LL-001]
MSKPYDTRGRAEILAADHFAPFRDTPGLDKIGTRELRTLDRFFRFAEGQGITVPGVTDFLSFVAADTSTRRLDDLRTAFDRLLSEGTPVREVVREAIRQKRPRSRSCDRRDREALRADPLMAPYRDLAAFGTVALEDLRVLARFLGFAETHGITVPSEADYLAFAADTASSRRLRSLKAALDALLPGNPAVHVVLAGAIDRKSPPKPRARDRSQGRPPPGGSTRPNCPKPGASSFSTCASAPCRCTKPPRRPRSSTAWRTSCANTPMCSAGRGRRWRSPSGACGASRPPAPRTPLPAKIQPTKRRATGPRRGTRP